MSRPVWTVEEDGTLVSIFHDSRLEISPGPHGVVADVYIDGRKISLGFFRHPEAAMRAAEIEVLDWVRLEFAPDDFLEG